MSFHVISARIDCRANDRCAARRAHFSYLHDDNKTPGELIIVDYRAIVERNRIKGGVAIGFSFLVWPIYSNLIDHLAENDLPVKFTSYWRCSAEQVGYTGPRGRIGYAGRLRAAPWRAWRTSRRMSRPKWVLRTWSTDSCNSSGTETPLFHHVMNRGFATTTTHFDGSNWKPSSLSYKTFLYTTVNNVSVDGERTLLNRRALTPRRTYFIWERFSKLHN